MSPVTNTFTVTFADSHSHSVPQSGVPGASKYDALLSVLQQAVSNQDLAAIVTTDTLTVTVTQP